MSDADELCDRLLWERARRGDGESFGVIFDRHRESVRTFCARRTGSVDAADDAVSIVFLEAWRRRADVDLVHDSALPWLYGVAANTLRRGTRTAARHRALLSRLPTERHAPDHADGVAARMDDAARVAELHDALVRLRRSDRDVLVLCLWQGLDQASAAVALGIPVGTVKSRLSRARTRLATAAAGPPARTTPVLPAPARATCQEPS